MDTFANLRSAHTVRPIAIDVFSIQRRLQDYRYHHYIQSNPPIRYQRCSNNTNQTTGKAQVRFATNIKADILAVSTSNALLRRHITSLSLPIQNTAYASPTHEHSPLHSPHPSAFATRLTVSTMDAIARPVHFQPLAKALTTFNCDHYSISARDGRPYTANPTIDCTTCTAHVQTQLRWR